MFGTLLDDADDTPSLICERLFLGSAPDARNLDKLQHHRIKYVLNMTGSTSYAADFFAASGHPHVTLLALDAHDEDGYDISAHFPMTLDFIHKSLQAGDGAVLVHCAAGVSRSATIVAAYLMVAYQIGAAEATLRVHQARACVCPNLGFLRQLLRFERMRFKFA
jgi:atypical dual specificity phosphatase